MRAMPASSAPLLRLLLNLLLAAAVLLQASTVLGMRTGMMPAAAEAATDAQHSPLPRCHDATPSPAAPESVPADCCGDGLAGSYCQWACALTLTVVAPPSLVLGAPSLSAAPAAPAPLEPRWRTNRMLRPPIG